MTQAESPSATLTEVAPDVAPEAASEAASERPNPSTSRWFSLVLLFLAGVLVYLPALRASYLLDDYLHASMIAGAYPAPRSPFDLYNFVSDADRAALFERGMLPWWSDPRLTIRFFRPLSSALIWAEHRVLGDGPLVLHLHSLAWWAAAVLAARALFRRLLAPRPAQIATFVFALAPCHALPLAWLANREALVSLTFGLAALGAYLRWRDARALGNGALAALLFGAAMLGGEYALSLAGYVLAIEIADRGTGARPWWERAVGLLPFAVPAAAYLLVRRALHYGTLGSGFYTDPFREPASFLRSAPRRVVTLLLEGWFSLDTETLTVETPWWVLAIAFVAAAALLTLPLRRALGRLDPAQQQAAAWLLPGSVLALGPVLAVVPSPRLLGASMLGVAAAVAWLLEHAWFPSELPAARRGGADLTGTAALAIGFAQLVHGPATSWLVGRHFQQSSASFAAQAAELRARLDDPASAEVMVLRGMGGSFFLPFALDASRAPPARWRILAQTGHALALRRDPRTLDIVVPPSQGVFPTGSGNLFRNERTRVAAGDVFTLPGLRVTILELGAEGPRAVRFELDRDLEDAPLVWIAEDHRGFPDAPPPQEGFGKPFDP
jgi:hypothetical protein